MNDAPLSLRDAQAISESIIGSVQWRGAQGFCACPGIDLHSSANAATDCKVVCDPTGSAGGTLAPGIYCFHDSCKAPCNDASFKLRSALGKRSPSTAPRPARSALPVRPPDPVFDPAKLEQIATKLPEANEEWFAARSAKRVDTRTPASFLHELYHPGEKVVIFDVFESQGQHVWECSPPPFDAGELDHFRTGKRVGVWFLANPVSGEFVPKENDPEKTTRRSWQTVTSFPYLVLESDKANPAHWLAALAQLPLPIAAIYSSGGVSIHALVKINAATKKEWDDLAARLKRPLITLGADRKAMSAVRLTRLPLCERLGTTNKEGEYVRYPEPRLQQLIYLNGAPTDAPICERQIP